MYITFGNGDSYVEQFSSSVVAGTNTDLGPLPNTTAHTSTPNGIAFDSKGNLYISNDGNNTITEFAPNGNYIGVFAPGAVLDQPASIAFDRYGNLFVANVANSSITKISPAGVSSVFISKGLGNPQGLAFGPNGNLYVSDQNSNSVKEITPSGQMSTFYKDGSYTIVNQLEGIAFDSSGNLYIASGRTNTIEEVSPSGSASVFASNGSDPSNPTNPAGIAEPIGLAFDSSGNLYIANFHHTQVPNEPYENHGFSYIDEYSPAGVLINAFAGNPNVQGADFLHGEFDLRDPNYIAIRTNSGVPVLNAGLQSSAGSLFALQSDGQITGYSGSNNTVNIPGLIYSGSAALPVTSIGTGAFMNSGMAAVTIPYSVASIGSNAFENCANLGSAVFFGDAPSMGSNVFGQTAANFTVYYFNGAVGFTSPTWNGYRSVNMGTYSPISPWLVTRGFAYNANLTDTPNGDGVSLLTDYAFNLDPTRNESAGIPQPVLAANQLSLNFYAGSPGVAYTVQTSSDLNTWSASGATISLPDANSFCTASVPISGPSGFMHIVVAY